MADMDDIVSLRAECNELKFRCKELAESKEMTERTIRAMEIHNKELIGKLEQANRKLEIYSAQLDIVRMMCGVGCSKTRKER